LPPLALVIVMMPFFCSMPAGVTANASEARMPVSSS
jgi:hypothetical protein